jgi:hypothetical protein
MDEYLTVYQFTGGMVGLTIATLLYMLGGRAGKWKRRFVGSFILAATVNILFAVRGSWQPAFLGIWPLLIAGFSLGYGGDVLGVKLLRRSLYAAGVLASGVLTAYFLGGNAWWVLVPHAGVGLWSIYLGIKNPIEAAAEEGLICVLLNLGIIAYPFVT